jgi:hypothetical protein
MRTRVSTVDSLFILQVHVRKNDHNYTFEENLCNKRSGLASCSLTVYLLDVLPMLCTLHRLDNLMIYVIAIFVTSIKGRVYYSWFSSSIFRIRIGVSHAP